jgi:hypothetical protein
LSDEKTALQSFQLSFLLLKPADVWLVVTIAVQDPKYLTQQFVISSQFKKQTDGSGWDPTPCSSRW